MKKKPTKSQERRIKESKKEEAFSKPILDRGPATANKRFLIGTPTIGSVRMEWVNGRYGSIIPTNFSLADVQQFMSPYLPIEYSIADAENLIAKMAIEQGFEWLLFWEDDNIPPNDALIRLNEYMITKTAPVIAGMYFTKSIPPEPMVYKEFGSGYFGDWKLGEKVWVKGCPFGFTLIHVSLLKALWDESPEYVVNGQTTRRVFNIPNKAHVDPETGAWQTETGTSDLAWCKRLVEDRIFEKAGWPEIQKKEYPILCDTSIFVKHIDRISGVQYPTAIPQGFLQGKLTWSESVRKMRTDEGK